MLKNNFKIENIDITLHIKRKSNDFLIIQIYADDVIFGAINYKLLCEEFVMLV